MEVFFILVISVFPIAIGLALFLWLPRKEAALPWQIYTILRGILVSLFLMPTIFAAGHGALITNTIAGAIAVIIFNGFDVGFNGVIFGSPGGPSIYLVPFFLGIAVYTVIFLMDIYIHKK